MAVRRVFADDGKNVIKKIDTITDPLNAHVLMEHLDPTTLSQPWSNVARSYEVMA